MTINDWYEVIYSVLGSLIGLAVLLWIRRIILGKD